MEATAESLPTNLKAKHRVPWGVLAVKKKPDNVTIESLFNKRNTTNTNAQELKKAKRELTNAYIKEQTEYFQDQIKKD